MSDHRFILLTGCSGGGKSTLLEELARRGFATFEEPGRAIVRAQQACGGAALPWEDLGAFLALCARKSIDNLAAVAGNAFFDRGLIDAVLGFERAGLAVPNDLSGALARWRYARTVFVAPPWPEIYVPDAERRHDLAAAVAEYEHILARLPALGYSPVLLPELPVTERADFVLRTLQAA